MDERLAKTVYPKFWKGVQKNHVDGRPVLRGASFDTETCYGRVFALGFYNGRDLAISYGKDVDHFKWLLGKCLEMVLSGGSFALSAHFISFDLGVLLWPVLNPLGTIRQGRAPRHTSFSFLGPRCHVEIFWGRPCFGKIKFPEGTVYLIDSYAYFSMSLQRSLRAINSDYHKLAKPKGLGKRIIPFQEVRPYLEGDVRGAHDLLLQIFKFHKEYRIGLCVSAPMMAGKIFRHHYLKKSFARPPAELLVPAMLSYHGGKNSFPGKPGWYQDAYDLDINSAYAEAMRQLPDFQNGRWVYEKGYRNENPHGIFAISGFSRQCRWGLLFTNDFKRVSGPFDRLHVTGYEVRAGLESGELQLDDISGWTFIENGRKGTSPFKDYVDDFYEKKRNATDPVWREFYKIMLNSLYGKFIARTEDDEENMVAGSMFDPAIASLITGFVRAKVHSLEHKYESIHTATDGFVTQRCPQREDMGESIGALKSCNFGPIAILRNKLYLHYDISGKLAKCGLHGFDLGPKALMTLWKTGKRKYTIDHLIRWKEAWHLGLPPGMPVTREKELKL